MTTKELRELDAWIADHVMGWKLIDADSMGWGSANNGEPHWDTGNEDNPCYRGFYPTTDPAAAMMVLEKCVDKRGAIRIHKIGDGFWMVHALCPSLKQLFTTGETLPLTICLFAKELFK